VKALNLLLPLIAVCSSAQPAEFAPSYFQTAAEAEASAKTSFAGGDVQVFELGDKKILVYRIFGSGVPEIAYGIYVPEGDGWRSIRWWRPATTAEFQWLEVDSGELFAVGKDSGTRTKIPLEKEGAIQPPQPTAASRRG
jgi:hypothetical protein